MKARTYEKLKKVWVAAKAGSKAAVEAMNRMDRGAVTTSIDRECTALNRAEKQAELRRAEVWRELHGCR